MNTLRPRASESCAICTTPSLPGASVSSSNGADHPTDGTPRARYRRAPADDIRRRPASADGQFGCGRARFVITSAGAWAPTPSRIAREHARLRIARTPPTRRDADRRPNAVLDNSALDR